MGLIFNCLFLTMLINYFDVFPQISTFASYQIHLYSFVKSLAVSIVSKSNLQACLFCKQFKQNVARNFINFGENEKLCATPVMF